MRTPHRRFSAQWASSPNVIQRWPWGLHCNTDKTPPTMACTRNTARYPSQLIQLYTWSFTLDEQVRRLWSNMSTRKQMHSYYYANWCIMQYIFQKRAMFHIFLTNSNHRTFLITRWKTSVIQRSSCTYIFAALFANFQSHRSLQVTLAKKATHPAVQRWMYKRGSIAGFSWNL